MDLNLEAVAALALGGLCLAVWVVGQFMQAERSQRLSREEAPRDDAE